MASSAEGHDFVLPFLCARASASWRVSSINRAERLPVLFRVSRGRRERGAAERRRRAGRDSTTSGNDDARRCTDKTCARSSPGGRRQRGRRAAREQGCHDGGRKRRREREAKRSKGEKRKSEGKKGRSTSSLWRLCFVEGASIFFLALAFSLNSCSPRTPYPNPRREKKGTMEKGNALSGLEE